MKPKVLKTLAFVLTLLVVFGSVASCKPNVTEKPDEFDYSALYGGKKSYENVDMKNYSMAEFGYAERVEQGFNGWYYAQKNAYGVRNLTHDGNVWQGEGVSFDKDKATVSSGAFAVRRYVHKGNSESATVFGKVALCSVTDKAVTLSVEVDGVKKYECEVADGDTEGVYFQTDVDLSDGTTVDFVFGSDGATFTCNPVVYFGDISDETLYRLTPFGKYYGDVFPWYDEENGKLYLGYIWTDDARLNDYKNALDVSDNMLTYTNVPEANNYNTWDRYKNGGRVHFLFDVNKAVDKSVYTFGARDNMVYRDKQNNRMLIVAGAYYRFDAAEQTSDLVIYASDDEFGLGWSRPAKIVAKGYSRNLPECPSLMKIGNRWYVFVSVAYNTAHQVGPLQYWTGDENVDCMDVDWQSKSFDFVDGEDLCAARPIHVKDKVYMWGWIPRTYDTMPWSPWGGYLNLPREVVQRADGSLGGRMDPYLTKLLNYGAVYRLNEGNYVTAQGTANYGSGNTVTVNDGYVLFGGNYSRNMVKFDLDMNGSDEAGAILIQDGKRYQVSVVKRDGNAYMQVSSPDDDKHKLNSCIKVENARHYEVKFTVDNGIVEFFVNDNYALTAHTAMGNGTYSLGLYGNGATFGNVNVYKLTPYCVL